MSDRSPRQLGRRAFLGATSLTLAGTMAGCGGLLESRTVRAPPVVEDRPDAVYFPTHVEGMEMAGMGMDGRYRFAVTYSFPHRFWLVNGTNRNKVALDGESAVHLMVTVWDDQTGTVLPTSNQHVTVSGNGEIPVDRSLWPMLSQNMGVHFGDNVGLAGDGTYDVTVRIGPISTRTTGALAGAFDAAGAATVEMPFEEATLEEISYRRLPDKQGTTGAVAPMEMEMMPIARVPATAELPGRGLGETTSGDAVFVVTVLEAPPTGIEGDDPYLVVSPRTPYNRYPLPFMGLSATVETGSGPAFDGPLTPTLDPDLGYHYGATVPGMADATAVRLAPGAPPQLARHEGYEMAFMELSETTLSL